MAVRRSRLGRWLSVRNQLTNCSLYGSRRLGLLRTGYAGSRISFWRNQCLRVLRDKPVCRAISRRGTLSRKYIRRILANMPTVITPLYPAQKVSRIVNSVGQFWTEFIPPGGSILGGIQHDQGAVPLVRFGEQRCLVSPRQCYFVGRRDRRPDVNSLPRVVNT